MEGEGGVGEGAETEVEAQRLGMGGVAIAEMTISNDDDVPGRSFITGYPAIFYVRNGYIAGQYQ